MSVADWKGVKETPRSLEFASRLFLLPPKAVTHYEKLLRTHAALLRVERSLDTVAASARALFACQVFLCLPAKQLYPGVSLSCCVHA